jgi:hypothetical protein
MKIKIKQVFYAALTARITSIFCLGVFYYALEAGMTDRSAIMALGLSFTAWLIGSFFVEVYKDGLTRQTLAALVEEGDQLKEDIAVEIAKEDDDDDEYPRHPMFE